MYDCDGASLAAIPVSPRDHGSMAAIMVKLDGDLARAVGLKAIDGAIDPASVRVARDHDTPGSDVTAAVSAVPDRAWKPVDVDVVALHRVREERHILDGLGLERLQLSARALPDLQRFERRADGIDAERQRRGAR